MKSKRLLTINETLIDKELVTASFNPQDSSQFLVCSKKSLTFYSIIQSYSVKNTEEAEDEEEAQSHIEPIERVSKVDFSTGPEDQAKPNFLDVIWDGYSNIYISTDQQQLYQVKFTTAEEKMQINLEANALKLVLTGKHLICSLDNSNMVWYLALPPEEVVQRGKKEAQKVDKDKLTTLKDEIEKTHTIENGPAKWVEYS